MTGPKCNPPTPTPIPSGRDAPPIAKLRTTRVLRVVHCKVICDRIVQHESSKSGKRICSAVVNVGPEMIAFKREVNGRKVSEGAHCKD